MYVALGGFLKAFSMSIKSREQLACPLPTPSTTPSSLGILISHSILSGSLHQDTLRPLPKDSLVQVDSLRVFQINHFVFIPKTT